MSNICGPPPLKAAAGGRLLCVRVCAHRSGFDRSVRVIRQVRYQMALSFVASPPPCQERPCRLSRTVRWRSVGWQPDNLFCRSTPDIVNIFRRFASHDLYKSGGKTRVRCAVERCKYKYNNNNQKNPHELVNNSFVHISHPNCIFVLF